ncbi:MAG: hypothetical protein ABJX32_06190 [Tateyamaria sp.]|uniref:hypothetical protein n=1 Tax=Tateyamaria sp. TaxID=1929288 RepID=UPI00329FE47D
MSDIVVTPQMVDALLGGQWPPDNMPATRKLLMMAVWRALEAQFGSEELHMAALLAGCLRDERLREFKRRDLTRSKATLKSWKAEARREAAMASLAQK